MSLPPILPEGSNPDDWEIRVVTPDDHDAIVLIDNTGKMTVHFDRDKIPADVFCHVLLNLAFNIMDVEGVTLDQVRKAHVLFERGDPT